MIYKIIGKNSFFDNVTRITCQSQNDELIELDVHNMFFDIITDTFSLELVDKHKNQGDYIMNGTVMNSEIISFGGLLMNIKNLKLKLNNDSKISCVITKI